MSNNILTTINKLAKKAGLIFKKHEPEILLVTGIGLGVATVVTACKATTKVDEIADEHKARLDDIHQKAEEDLSYDENEKPKELMQAYAKTGVELVKLYAVPTATGVVSITCVLASHNLMKKRVVGLSAAYAAVNSTFNNYRARVIAKEGKEADNLYMHGITEETVVEEVVNEETGEVTTKVETVKTSPEINPYTWVFDMRSNAYSRQGSKTTQDMLNRIFLKQEAAKFTDYLNANGYVWLNDICKDMDIRRYGDESGHDYSREGQVVGWLSDDYPSHGDGFIDFDVKEVQELDPGTGKYVTVFLLNFNCDGYILDKI